MKPRFEDVLLRRIPCVLSILASLDSFVQYVILFLSCEMYVYCTTVSDYSRKIFSRQVLEHFPLICSIVVWLIVADVGTRWASKCSYKISANWVVGSVVIHDPSATSDSRMERPIKCHWTFSVGIIFPSSQDGFSRGFQHVLLQQDIQWFK